MKVLIKPICLALFFLIPGVNRFLYASDSGSRDATGITQQQKKLTGIVQDDQGPIIGASVSVKGATTGTVTDIDGKFTLEVPDGATLIIRYIGYVTQEVKYTGQSVLNINLKEDSQTLSEVVVTAMGIKKEKRALSYAMSELKSEEMRTVPTLNLGSSLYGKVAGMRIVSTAAGPTGGTKIQIRGLNSIAGNNRPLVVIDGVPISDNDSNWDGRERNQTQTGSALNDINPDDIESLSVLKGANAAALYGSRASNGVILITMKKGKAGKKGLGVEVGMSYTTDRLAYLPKYQNVFGQGTKGYFDIDAATGQPKPEYSTYRSFGPRMDGTPVLWWDGQVRPFSPQPDNYKDLFQNGYTNNNNISVSSASENTTLRVSYANMNYEGFLENMKQERHNFNIAGTAKLSERISLDANVSYSRIKTTNAPTRIDRISNFPIPRSEIAQLYKDHYKNANGYYLTNEINNIASSNKDNILNYLLWQQNENRYVTSRDRIVGTIAANIKIIDPLNLRLTVGTDRIRDLKEDKEMFKKYSDPADMNTLEGLYRKTNEDYTKKFFEALLTFNKTLSDNFDLSLTGGASAEYIDESQNKWESNGLKINGLFSSRNNKLSPNSSTYSGFGYNRSEYLSGAYGSGQLAYKRYLYLDVTGRNDWTSRLPKGARSYFYPSVGLGFVFSDALKMPAWLTFGKLRASYAIVGNSTPSIYFANSVYNLETYDDRLITNTFGSEVPPVSIKPEKTYAWEFGLDLRALDNRIGIDVAYFNNETRNQILSIDIPVSAGARKMKTNAGTISNEGVEIQLKGTPIQTKDFSWDATINFSYTKNKLKSFVPGLDVYNIGSPWSAANFIAQPGNAAYTVMIKKWKRDDHGNKIVNANGAYVQESDYTYAGEAMPKFTGGFNTSIRYKDFLLVANLDAQFGGKILSFTNNYLKSSGAGTGSLLGRDEEYGGLAYYINNSKQKIALDSHSATAPGTSFDGRVYHDGIIAEGVKADGTANDIIVSAESYYNSRYNIAGSEDNLYDNTYIKFRELSISYQVPAKIYSKARLQGLSLSLIGSNLFYIYKRVPNIDPESTLGTSGTNQFVEYTAYPSMRSFGFSIKTRF